MFPVLQSPHTFDDVSGVAQTMLNNLSMGMTLEKSIDAPRLHSQLENPDAKVVEAEGMKALS